MLAIVYREVDSIWRNRWAPALILVPLFVLGLLVVVRWPATAEVDVAGLRARSLFALIGYTTLGCILLLVPAFPATSIVREVRQGTLTLLFNTPIKGSGIFMGKFLGTLACVLLPLAISGPAVSACYAMGGIDFRADVLLFYAFLLLVTLQFVATSLWVSCFSSSPIAAIRTTYGLIVVLSVVSLGPSLLLSSDATGIMASGVSWLRCVSPLPPAMEILGHGSFAQQASATTPATVMRFCLISLLLTTILSTHAMWVLKPTLLDKTRAAGTMTQDLGNRAQWARRLLFLVDPQRRSQVVPDWINPVMIKELRSRRFGRGHWMFRLIAMCAVVSLAVTYVATTGSLSWKPETIGGMMVLLQTALLIMFTPSLASGIISDERESGGWTLLQTTPLSASQIVRGKLLSVTWTILLILFATLPGYAVMVLIKPVLRQQVASVLVTLLLLAMLTMCASAAIGSFFRRSAQATIAAYLVLVVVLLGPLVVWLGRDAPFGRQTVERSLSLSPVAAAMSQIETPGFDEYQLLPTAWWSSGLVIVFSVALLCWKTWQLRKPD